jgi:outer membrane protein OmpA-like peptidoglycan-associated protein
VLNNVFFDTDRSTLKKESEVELEKLCELMKSNPKIRVEIAGHTDNQGSKEHNLTLSRNRAKAVYDYLVAHGIKADRMRYKGYGFDQPVASNDTPEGRALNRRTEFKIVGK